MILPDGVAAKKLKGALNSEAAAMEWRVEEARSVEWKNKRARAKLTATFEERVVDGVTAAVRIVVGQENEND